MRLLVGVFAMVVVLASSTETRAQVTDNKLWTAISVEAELVDAWKAAAEFQHRLGFDSGHDKTFGELGLGHELLDGVRLAVGLRLGVATDQRGDQNSQFRVFGDGVWLHKMNKLRLGLRGRFQSESEAGESKQTARLRFKAGYRPKKKLELYSALELFYRADVSEFRQYRVTIGIKIPFVRDWKADLAYRFEDEYNVGNPETSHIIAIGFDYELDEALLDD